MSSETPAADVPLPRSARWGPRIVLVLVAAVVVPVGVSILYSFSPTEYSFYPPCLFRLLLGVHCPGCGITRGLHALLNGNIAQAFAYNPLFILALPIVIYGGLCLIYETWTGKKSRGLRTPDWALKTALAVLLVYFALRNVDVYPLNLLAPHEI